MHFSMAAVICLANIQPLQRTAFQRIFCGQDRELLDQKNSFHSFWRIPGNFLFASLLEADLQALMNFDHSLLGRAENLTST